ncbi:hypothetical protein [Parapedobacter lycopersici]|uniref:hypothetical protein n=1 Tax=Parapedobacter lycopersici TaxID=1864939 RepID=UPI00214DE390|nr:hypothetical protein [Parapedobacter lycopersici]
MWKNGLLLLWLLGVTRYAVAQTDTDTLHHRKIYAVSGLGWGFSLGETSDVLRPKFSNSLGLDISLANRHYFVYPTVDFLTFEYNQQENDPAYPYSLEKGRGNIYILNLAGGIRKQVEKLNLYAYAGPGIGLMSEPRAEVVSEPATVKINTVFYVTPSLRGGVGADYKLGGFFVFLEAGWLHPFRRMQDRQVHVLSLFGGLKTDITVLKDKVAQVIGIDGAK